MIGRIQFFTNLTQKTFFVFRFVLVFVPFLFISFLLVFSCSLLTSTYTSVGMFTANINYYLLSTTQINCNEQDVNIKVKRLKRNVEANFMRRGFLYTFRFAYSLSNIVDLLSYIVDQFSDRFSTFLYTSESTYHKPIT